MSVYHNVNGVIKEVTDIYENVNGVIHKIDARYQNVNGVIRQTYGSGIRIDNITWGAGKVGANKAFAPVILMMINNSSNIFEKIIKGNGGKQMRWRFLNDTTTFTWYKDADMTVHPESLIYMGAYNIVALLNFNEVECVQQSLSISGVAYKGTVKSTDWTEWRTIETDYLSYSSASLALCISNRSRSNLGVQSSEVALTAATKMLEASTLNTTGTSIEIQYK